jgi:GntR family transcriptional regulator/MocR family aminotransferase
MLLLPKLDHHSEIPMYVQLYDYLKNEIVAGRIPEQSRVPSVRKLADFLGISTTPVELAYNQLVAEGFLVSRPRSGYVVHSLPDPYGKLGSGGPPFAKVRRSPLRDEKEFAYDFHLSKNDFSHFPFQIWRRLYNESLKEEQKQLLFYGDPQGEAGLRQEIAAYLYQFRGVKSAPDQIVIGAEQHQLLSILSLLLREHSLRIGVENPGYPLLPSTFRQHGYEVVPISLAEDGIQIGELYESGVRIVSVTPSHQFPRGMIMPIAKRLQLLEWANDVNGFIIEDDYDGEFRYHGRPIPSLQGLVPSSRVVYLGGFSQVLAPALCIHYLVLPESLIDWYDQLYDQTLFEQASSRLHQRTLQLFMERGYLGKHVRKMRNLYRKKHDVLIRSIQEHFREKAEIIGRDAGFHLLLRVNSPYSEKELLQLARGAGIRISSATYTWLHSPVQERKEFLLGFGGIEIDRIEEGIKRLKEVWFDGNDGS